MPHNIRHRRLWIHPSVPHHLMSEKGILGDAHSVSDAACAIVRLTTMVGVGVRKNNLHATAGNTGARAWTLTPVVVPATHHFDSELVHVVVVLQGGLTAIEGAIALLVIGVAPRIPIFPQPLIATIFHSPHGVLLRLVDVKHFTTVFCFIDVKHLATTDGASAMRVVLVANGFHLQHVLAAYALVAALIEENRRIVAVVDDGIAHQGRALLPAGTLHILLGITGGHGLWQSNAVTTLDVLFPWSHVHPAYHIAAAFHHQAIAIVAQPGRHADAYTRPLIGGPLGIAMHHHHAVIQPYLALAKACLAETGPSEDPIVLCGSSFERFAQIRLHRVEIPIPPRPEVQALHLFFSLGNDGLTWE